MLFNWVSRFVPSSWWSKDPSVRWVEQFAVDYFPVWTSAVASVVALKFYEQFTGLSYLLFGIGCVLPVVAVPLFSAPKRKPGTSFLDQYWVKIVIWDVVFSFIGNHFLTYYFFNMLGCRYTTPEGFWLNGVPLVMHLLTVVYFLSYHTFSSMILRRLNFSKMSLFSKCVSVFGLAYTTAVMEAVSISAFPHYTDKRCMSLARASTRSCSS
eukprot:m.88344 g.88344  ORF g.88344 m.88344 type:complete len:210 (-) comp12261_c0_seq7:1419-2048(-)